MLKILLPSSIIALMLGRLRMSVDEAIARYAAFARKVFSHMESAGDWKFSASKFEEAIKEIVRERTGDPDERMMDLRSKGAGCNTCVFCDGSLKPCSRSAPAPLSFVCAMTAFDISFPHLFRTYKARKNRTFDCTIWEAARATSAMRTFFKPIVIGSPGISQPFVDGGIGCNNPIKQVLDEAEHVFPGRSPSCIISIGAGQAQTINIQSADVVTALQGMAEECEITAQEIARRFRDRSNLYFRFNVEQGLQAVGIAQWERLDDVNAHTARYIRLADVDRKLDAVVPALHTVGIAVRIRTELPCVRGPRSDSS
jgi:hypothetical protein